MKDFLVGFYKQAIMMKGERADKTTGLKPHSMVSSKGRFTPNPLPSVDKDIPVSKTLDPTIHYQKIPYVRRKV